MFEPLFARLSDRYHLVAPDYPGFGHSDWPDPKKFTYTFDHYAEIMNHFTEGLGLSRYTLYMQDYGGPVGFRMALVYPERIEALIVQDAVAHNEGLGSNWKTRRAFWADRAANESALRTNLLSLATTRTRHVGNDPNVERYDPDLWTDEFYFLNQPGQAEIQSDLFYDYRTNVEAYPKWQAWMREKQPLLLVIWGKYDLSFDPGEPERYRKDVPNVELHVLDAGHFALDTAADEMPHWSGSLSLLHVASCRRSAPADAASENAGRLSSRPQLAPNSAIHSTRLLLSSYCRCRCLDGCAKSRRRPSRVLIGERGRPTSSRHSGRSAARPWHP
jgi:pimeloyl-ACP methyl ester carboxylesterase